MFGLTNQQMGILQPLGILVFASTTYYLLIINLHFRNMDTIREYSVYYFFN